MGEKKVEGRKKKAIQRLNKRGKPFEPNEGTVAARNDGSKT